MEDYAKTYFASLICNHSDSKHKQSACALRNSIHIKFYCFEAKFSFHCYINTHKRKGLKTSSILFFEPLVGFEPTTPRLQITCSGQLS